MDGDSWRIVLGFIMVVSSGSISIVFLPPIPPPNPLEYVVLALCISVLGIVGLAVMLVPLVRKTLQFLVKHLESK